MVVQSLFRVTFGAFISAWLHLCGNGFLNDISVEVLVEDCFLCSFGCGVPLSYTEYHITGAVKHLGQWIVYKVLLNRYAVPNEYVVSGSVIQHLSFLFGKVDKTEASEHTEMLQRSLAPVPGLVRSLADYRSHWSAVLEIDHH
jgi:hypothetical protein